MSETMAADGLTTALRSAGLYLVGPLGTGAGGPRWGARDEAGTRWVVTVLTVRSTVHRADLTDRVSRLGRTEHEHVAQVGPIIPLPGGRVAVLHQEVPGTDLATVQAARGPWQPGEVVTVLVPLAGALAALHDAGLSHGDVAPGNVVLTPEGRAVLVDVIAADDPREAGTPGFAAPERVRAAEPPGDVYALGRLGLHLLGIDAAGIDAAGPGTTGRGTAGPDRADHVGTAVAAADAGAPSTVAVELAQATDRLVAVLRAACDPTPAARPTAIGLASQVYVACPPVPVGQPDPSVLARLTLRRLGAVAAADRTRRVTASTRPGRGRHRQRRRGRRILLGCAVGVVLAVCAGTVAATVQGTGRDQNLADPAAVQDLDGRSGPVRSGPVRSAPGGVASAVPAAVRLTYARAEALAAGDPVRLGAVTVPGSPAARRDRVSLEALMRSVGTPAGADTRVRVDQVRLLDPVGDRSGCHSCARVLVVADVRAGDAAQADPAATEVDASRTRTTAPEVDGVAVEPGPAPAGVVLVMRPTSDGWRVSDVKPAGL